MDSLAEMFKKQHELNLVLGSDVGRLEGQERIQYIKDMILAATNELHEALNEIGWKPWATSRHIHEEAAFGELRDAWQFLMNAMMAVDERLLRPEMVAYHLYRAHNEKLKVNHERAAAASDGVPGKCYMCKRDLAEVETKEVISTTGQFVNIHCVCGALLGSRSV